MNSLKSPVYTPLSAGAVRRIIAFDRAAGFGPGGTQPNRNRFYNYLTQCGADIQIRTVAVKSYNKTDTPLVKEVLRCSADDPLIHVLDLACTPMSGYHVDWSPEGIGQQPHWIYGKRWESGAYARRCCWKINAPVINPELLKRAKRFRWAAWNPSTGHLLDYLKIYSEHPEIEFLSKGGVDCFCTKVSIVRKLKADKKFRAFFCNNLELIRTSRFNSPEILRAYSKGISIAEAAVEATVARSFRGYDLPKTVPAIKAHEYLLHRTISKRVYCDYLSNCQKAGLNLADTKVSYPLDFKARYEAVRDLADIIRRRENAEAAAKINTQLASIAASWKQLERPRKKWQIIIPRTEQEFQDEGKAMSNCLIQYAAKVARGQVVVIFLRKGETPQTAYIAAAYDPAKKQVVQCYGIKNSKPPKQITALIEKTFSRAACNILKPQTTLRQ
jgi:hypothetical protein